MNGKIKRKIQLCLLFVAIVVFGTVSSILFMKTYEKIAYDHLSAFCETIVKESPEIEPLIMEALKEYHSKSGQEIKGNNYLNRYGYHRGELVNGVPFHVLLIFLFLPCFIICIFVLRYLFDRRQVKNRIDELTDYLEKVNIGAGGTLIQQKEDDFSHLQDEVYKTVTTLYQTREAAVIAKNNFADNLANIAHQLKTPITASFLSLQLMKKEADNEYAEQIERQLERLNRLEESLLMISKIDAGTLPLKHEKVDVYTILCLAAENLSDLLQKESISVEIPEKGCVEFLGDMEWTMEALMNLMKNCMEHSKPGSKVVCDYSSNPLYVEIRIWDNGDGFDIEDIPHLFERFYRGRRATGNGIGIGLALAKSIFELQNGNIVAYNLREGGACFEIKIYSH